MPLPTLFCRIHLACYLICLFSLPSLAQEPLPNVPQSDRAPLIDPKRPVSEIGPDYIVLQWFTQRPCETRAQIRQSSLPATLWYANGQKPDVWGAADVRTVTNTAGLSTFHTLKIEKLSPGKRYFWRVFAPDTMPTSTEAEWGAIPPYRREYAVSTLAGKGKKTILHLPIKVLLMPNVINVASAKRNDGTPAPLPPKMTDAELDRIKEEYAVASRFYFVNTGMRVWVDFQIFVDDRYQRWGDEPADTGILFKSLPLCRSYDGVDFRSPGGGAFTIVDTADITRVNRDPVDKQLVYVGQVEQAFPKRFKPDTGRWETYDSGGGTFGLEGFPKGIPARSQFLGGGDTAWLVSHEFHHQLESEGAFSFANREDDRVVLCHPTLRKYPDTAWGTAGRHGEHWDVLSFWDRTITDAQWLRLYFGETVVTNDEDGDGVPDVDSRLPLDEKRLGYDKKKFATDGRMRDLDKIMLSTFAPAPLQKTVRKPPTQAIMASPTNSDSDGDGIPDDRDPYPLYPYPPFIYPLAATVDGDGKEWEGVPASGKMDKGGIQLTFKQAHDDNAYYGLVVVHGPWRRVRLTLDGEGKGVYGSDRVQGIQIVQLGKLLPEITPIWGDAPGLKVTASVSTDGWTVVEFSLPNRGGKWFWDGGGREIGASIDVADNNDTIYSVYEPYRLFYATMLESTGKPSVPTMPNNTPAELTAANATKVITAPGTDSTILLAGMGWAKNGAILRHTGDTEGIAYLDNINTVNFDLWIRFEAKTDGILGAFTPDTKPESMGAASDYIVFVGGYDNTQTRFRLFGRESGSNDARITPGDHTLQLTRRNGEIWCLFDGLPILYAHDPAPTKIIARLAILGGYNGAQVVKEIRARY